METENDRLQSQWARIWPIVLIFILYCLLTAVITWPALARLNEAIPGSEGDALNHLWTFRSVKQALLSGRSPFFSGALYFPEGVSLLSHNIAWVHIAAWLPLQAFIGEAAAYTIIFLLIFPFNGIATYLFAREISGSREAAFVGGLVVAFWPYILSHHNHPNLILIAFVPLIMLYLRRLLRGSRWQDAVYLSLVIALCGIARWQVLLIAAPLIGMYFLVEIAGDTAALSKRLVGLLLAAGLGAVLLMAPLLLPVAADQIMRANPDSLLVPDSQEQADLLAYVLPNRYHPLWGEAIMGAYEQVGVSKVLTPFVGFVVLGLAILGVLKQWRDARFWLVAMLVYLLLALGSSLHVNGVEVLLLPLALIRDSYLLQIVRHPDRFNVILSLPVAMLATLGMKTILAFAYRIDESSALHVRGWQSTTTGFILTTVVALLIFGEYLVSYPLYPLDTPSWYAALAAEEGRFGVLDLPMDARSFDKEYMLYQITHGKPLVGGHVSRIPTEARAFIESVPLLANMTVDPKSAPTMSRVSQQLNLLSAADIRYVVLHKKYLSDSQEADWRAWMVLPPIFEDEDVIVYKTAVSDADVVLEQVVAVDSEKKPQIGLVSSSISPNLIDPGGWFSIDLGWGGEKAVADDYVRCLHLMNETKLVAETCETLSADWPTSQWGTSEIVFDRQTLQADPFWLPGSYTVTTSLHSEKQAFDPVPAGTFTLEDIPRDFAVPDPQTEMGVRFGEVLELTGYDKDTDESLALTLYWHALQRMEPSYKIFVHLINSADNTVAAQADFIPQEWTYPTNWWERGEYIADKVQIPLQDLPPGRYEIRIGVYDPETGERLLPSNSDGIITHDSVLTLDSLVIP